MRLFPRLLRGLVSPFLFYFKWIIATTIFIMKNPTLKIGPFAQLKNVEIGKYNYFSKNVVFSNSEIGDYSYLGENTRINNTTIGKFTCIGPNVLMGLGVHPTNTFVSIHPAFYSTAKQVGTTFVEKNKFDEISGKINIGNDVWIGANVIISANVNIGDGTIVASGSVVTKNIAPYSIVAGIPAITLKKRFSEHEIEKLVKIKWWNNTESFLRNNKDMFLNIDDFLKKHI